MRMKAMAMLGIYLILYTYILPRIWSELQFQDVCAHMRKRNTIRAVWTWCKSAIQNDAHRDFGQEIALYLELRFRYLVSPGGSEGEKRRPLDHL